MNSSIWAGPTTGTMTMRALRRYPQCIAFAWDGGQLTYQATADLISRMQSVLLSHGVNNSHRVALLGGNRAELWCAMVAAQACGAAVTSLHPKGSLPDHIYQLEDSGANFVVVDVLNFSDRGGEIAALQDRLVLTLGAADYGTDLLQAAEDIGAASFRDLAVADDISALNYTGGTTGRAKGVMRRQRATMASSLSVLAAFELPESTRYLAVAPISHVSGTKVLPVLIRGGTVRLITGFDPEHVLATIARERIDFTLLVPTMIYTLLDSPALGQADTSSLQLLLYGASPMSPTRLKEGMERFGPIFSQLYGQSECYPIAVLPRADHDTAQPDLLAACGFPVPGCDVAILDDDGQAVAPGQSGELCVRAAHVMDEYWNQPEQTEQAFAHGWLHTGDIGRADDEGRLYIVDRKKDMIVTGGFNVYSREVEDAISRHPDVAVAAVFGVPDPKWGEAVTALVVRRPGAQVQAEELQRQVRAQKGPTHTPKHIEFVDELPTTSLGKVDKKSLRARFWANQTRSVG